jgi:hypothetical protein
MMPQMVNTLENWAEKGKRLFQEEPHDEDREYVKATRESDYTKGDYLKDGYVGFDERLSEPYKTWAERRRGKGLHVPETSPG